MDAQSTRLLRNTLSRLGQVGWQEWYGEYGWVDNDRYLLSIPDGLFEAVGGIRDA